MLNYFKSILNNRREKKKIKKLYRCIEVGDYISINNDDVAISGKVLELFTKDPSTNNRLLISVDKIALSGDYSDIADKMAADYLIDRIKDTGTHYFFGYKEITSLKDTENRINRTIAELDDI